MLIATRPRRTIDTSPPRHDATPARISPATVADALLREHADASALLGGANRDAWSELAPVARELSREARDVARSLVGDSSIAPPAPVDAPAVVVARDLAVAQRGLRRVLTTRPARAQCAMLMVSLARVAELRDAIGAMLEATTPRA